MPVLFFLQAHVTRHPSGQAAGTLGAAYVEVKAGRKIIVTQPADRHCAGGREREQQSIDAPPFNDHATTRLAVERGGRPLPPLSIYLPHQSASRGCLPEWGTCGRIPVPGRSTMYRAIMSITLLFHVRRRGSEAFRAVGD